LLTLRPVKWRSGDVWPFWVIIRPAALTIVWKHRGFPL
jgi:hypothetical protein